MSREDDEAAIEAHALTWTGHDDLCPNRGSGLMPGMTCGYCVLITEATNRERERCKVEVAATAKWCREDEQARVEAVCRMLLDSGDITPMGVRMLGVSDE